VVELPESAAERSPPTFPEIPVGKRGAGGGEDDTVPFDFTFAGISADCDDLRQFNDDSAGTGILCRIAHIPSDSSISHHEEDDLHRLRTEQFRSAIAFCLSDHDY
jgi:hypothetical protein